jgi:rhodanese-related sulfurtransferase
MQHAPRFLRLCEEARSRIAEITAEEFLAQKAPGQKAPVDFLLVDVREDHEWQAGRIPGARHLGRGIVERDIERLIPNLDAPIVLYCGGGYRSALAADSLARMGYRQVYSLAGGYRAWKEAGRQIDTEPEPAAPEAKKP